MTRPHDMKHLAQLYPVALADVQHLREKEKTYQGSWKRSGGRSAWFMLRRKIDRLLEMMKKPEDLSGFSIAEVDRIVETLRDRAQSAILEKRDLEVVRYLRDSYMAENVFAKIREAPGGEDGSVLAEIRDLRRYLLLVEAEMVSRGAIEEPNEDGDGVLDLYSRVAHATGARREDVKAILLCAAYSGGVNFLESTEAPERKFGVPSERRVPRYDPGTVHEPPFVVQAPCGGTIEVRGVVEKNVIDAELAAFEGLDPWLILKSGWRAASETEQERGALNVLYDEHGAGLMKLTPDLAESQRFQLDMVVRSNASVASTLIKSALECYVEVEGAKLHVLDVSRVPPDYRSAWPHLQREYNAHELSMLENWKTKLYSFHEPETKWKLKEHFEAWIRET